MSQFQSLLPAIYGEDTARQVVRYSAAVKAFRHHFGSAGDIAIFRAPGRVNLIGEHTDYNHGFVLPAALDKDTLIVARSRADTRIRLANIEPQFPPFELDIAPPIAKAPTGDWSNYVRGAAHVLAGYMGRSVTGFDGLVVGAPEYAVPRGAGLSSSTAFTVVVMVTLAHMNPPQPTPMQLARLCSDAEWYVGTRGGIMDQMAAFFTQRNQALFLDCRPDASGDYRFDRLPLPDRYRILVVDSGVKHSNTRGEFNQRVAACRAGVSILRRSAPGITHLRDVQDTPWSALEAELPEEITVAGLEARHLDIGDVPGLPRDALLRVRACCRHVWTENRRVLDALDALRNDEIAQLGRLMGAAHASARDDYQISCPEIEVIVNAAREVDGVAGARLTCAGWGGCAVALVKQESVRAFTQHVTAIYRERFQRSASVFLCSAGPGAGVVVQI